MWWMVCEIYPELDYFIFKPGADELSLLAFIPVCGCVYAPTLFDAASQLALKI